MWEKKGLLFNVDGKYGWNKSHAQVPVVDVLADRLRIYYSSRNSLGKSNTSFIEVDKTDPSKILFESPVPLFNLGKLGSFDDSGVMPTSIISLGDKKYLYYVGWTTRQTVPYQNAVGLAVSDDGGTVFRRLFEGPIITVNRTEPYFSGTAYVLKEDDVFRMWYLSCKEWVLEEDRPEPLYNIKYAESTNGIDWIQTGKVAIELSADEGGLVSASVVAKNGKYKMWYGKRKRSDYRQNINNTYRIGYAESNDGKVWTRRDELAQIDISRSGWDSEMISYPNVVSVEGRWFMFYNGNSFGKSGFGYAIWKD